MRPRGKYQGLTKSGRERREPMSLRLRRVVTEHASRVAIGSKPGSPDPDALVVGWSDKDCDPSAEFGQIEPMI
jgi:hypothetical protein